MPIRSISVKDLEEKLAIDKEQINDYFKTKADEIFLSLSNNHSSILSLLLEKYCEGEEFFFSQLEKTHYEITIVNNQSTHSAQLKRHKAFDVAKIFQHPIDKKTSTFASKASEERLYETLKSNKEIYNTGYYEGIINLYGLVLEDIKIINKNTKRREQMSPSLDIFLLSKELLKCHINFNLSPIASTVILLRQAIETKIKHTIGCTFLDNNGNTKFIPTGKIIKSIIKIANRHCIKSTVDLQLIYTIYKWCNHYIHTGLFSFPAYAVEWAHHTLEPFFINENIGNGRLNYELSMSIKGELIDSFYTSLEEVLSTKKTKVSCRKGQHHFILR